MTSQFGTFLKEKNSTSEYSPHEAHRNMRVKVFKTLEDIKKDNLKENFTSINNVRDFLQDTNHSVCSEDDNLPKDSNQLERRIIKQQYLVNNNLFDPADYFGGLEVSNLEDNLTDQRLFDDMLFYLPTEMEEVHQEHDNFLKERSKKNESNIPKKVESSYKLPTHNKTPSIAKVEATKNIPKVYPETTKENKEIQFTDNPCYILNSHAKSKAESDKDSIQSTSASVKLKNKFNTSSQKAKLNSSTNSSQELKSVASGLFKRKITSESNNKENKEDQAGSRNKLSSSTIKTPSLQDSKGCFRKAFESNANKRSLNTSSQNNKTEKSFSNQNRSFASSSMNKSLSSIQANKLEFQTKQGNSEELPIKKKINKRVMSVCKPKVENQSSIRSKTKSIDRNKEMKANNNNRSRDVQKNFSSFNGTLNTEEEGDFLFKSYNALTRPRTTNNVQNEENSYVLKGILSPKVNKSLIGGKPNLNKTQKKPEKVVEQKGQPSNPLKFLNDLLNKRKISYSSSDHLRMPKKPTFLGKKNESPTSQIGSKPTKTISKSDNFETKIVGHLRKGQSQSITNYISPTASQKNLI